MKKKVAVYCRVSTYDQEKGMKSQEKALKDYCIAHNLTGRIWYRDRMSGATTDRPKFKRLQDAIFAGKIDTVVVWKLDRLSRSLQDGINLVCNWLKKDIRIIAISQQLDFSGIMGKAFAALAFAFAEMGRENLRENTKRGIAAARARGVKLGKRPKLFAKQIVPLIKDGWTIAKVAKKFNKSSQAIYDALKRDNINLAKLRKQIKA